MFCHLFRLMDRTSLPLNEFEVCTSECKYYKDKKLCSIAEEKTENLTKGKYNWILETLIHFDEPRESKSKNTRYLSAICLIHPSHNDMWIVNSLRHDKVNDKWEPVFKLYFGSENKEFLTLIAVNNYLSTNGYLGRKLTESDFEFNRKVK
jgi:hypothetical protein